MDYIGLGGLLLSLFFYTAYVSYRFGSISSKLVDLEKRISSIEESGSDLKIIIRLEERLINLEKKLEFLFQKIVGGEK